MIFEFREISHEPGITTHFFFSFQEHFYDAASSTGYISWRLKTVQRKIRQGSAQPLFHLLPPPPGGLKSPKISACDAVERLVVFHKVIILLRGL